jgi:hypothetical protein
MQHQHLARAAHRGDRRAGHARERGIGELVDAHDLRDRQAGRIDAVEAARDELVARDEVRAGRHEAQIQRIALRRAVDHAAQAGAQHLHRNREIAVGDQRDFRLQREHARDLADHAVLADDRRAVLDALLRALPDDDLLRERVARVVLDLDRRRLRRDVLAQLEHRAQMDVFLRQHRGLVGLGGQLQVALAQRVVLVAQRRAGDRDVGRAHEQVARHERRALQRYSTVPSTPRTISSVLKRASDTRSAMARATKKMSRASAGGPCLKRGGGLYSMVGAGRVVIG